MARSEKREAARASPDGFRSSTAVYRCSWPDLVIGSGHWTRILEDAGRSSLAPDAGRDREHLTDFEADRLIKVAKGNR
jgi:hypothetical protein